MTANDRTIGELPDDQTFDLLIYEEAAKAYPLEVLAPMCLARRWLLIGDQNQLPPFNIEAFSRELAGFFAKVKEGEDLRDNPVYRRLLEQAEIGRETGSMALRTAKFFEYLHEYPTNLRDHKFSYTLPFEQGEDKNRRPPTPISDTLQIQWRMHPDIGRMLRLTDYYPFLQNGDENYLRQHRRHGIQRLEDLGNEISKRALVWIDTPLADSWETSLLFNEGEEISGDRSALGGGYRNPYEATVIYRFLERMHTRMGGLGSLMIISPYRQQVRLLKRFLWDRSDLNPNMKKYAESVSTVDSAQGRQAEVVIVSLVRNNPAPADSSSMVFGFLTSQERAGVMFSRAESLLVVVGSSGHFAKGDDLGIRKVYDFIENNGLVIDANSLIADHDMKRLGDDDKKRKRNILGDETGRGW